MRNSGKPPLADEPLRRAGEVFLRGLQEKHKVQKKQMPRKPMMHSIPKDSDWTGISSVLHSYRKQY
jgi:hypothetical protein